MSIIYVLIPIAVLFVIIGLGVFFWAVKSRQFDDLDKEAYSILFDNQVSSTKPKATTANTDGMPTPTALLESDTVLPLTKDQDQGS